MVGGVADFVVEQALELRKEREVAVWAVSADTEDGVAALEIEELGFVGEFVAERLVEPVCERAGGVAGVVETANPSLAEHGVRVDVIVSLVDMVHVRSLLSADVWETNYFCRIKKVLDLIEIGVLVLRVYCDGRTEFFHEWHLAHCGDPFLHFK